MGDVTRRAARCASCFQPYGDENAVSVFAGERPGCEHCGGTAVRFEIEVSDSVQIHEMVKLKATGEREGRRKVFVEGKSGDEFHRDDQRWTKVARTIDRDNDRYDEVITDAVTGEIRREVHEPLSEHTGRGSDRPDRRMARQVGEPRSQP